MPVQVSVVVAADFERAPHGVIGSIDAQSLPTDSFELAVLDLGLGDEQRNSLERLAARRTNVRVLAADDDWPSLLAGTYVLEVGHDQRLFPDSLKRLLTHAETHDLDAVAGRVVQLGQPLLSTFLVDEPSVHAEARDTALAGSVRLLRRDRLRREGNALAYETDGARVGVLAGYPAAHDLGPARQLALILSVDAPTLSWQGNDIAIAATGTVAAEDAPELTPVLLVRQLGSFLAYILPSAGTVSPGAPGAMERRWEVTSTFSPLTAAGGVPLPAGQWQVDVVLAGPARASAQVRLPGAQLAPALLEGLAVVPSAGPRDTLHLDVGPTRQPLVDGADPAAASIVESAAGSLLRLPLPEIHVQTANRLPGFIALDRFQLPATIETESGTAELTAFVSGLAGTYEVSTQFGSGPMRPTGLTLEVSGDGTMAIVPTRAKPAAPAKKVAAVDALNSKPSRPKKAPARKAPARARKAAAGAAPASPAAKPKKQPTNQAKKKAKKAPAKKPAKGPVARLRRALPSGLEPGIRQLRKQPLARALYRRATGLTGAKPSGARSK